MARPPGGEIVVYGAPDGGVRVDGRLDRDTVWLTQDQMSRFFGRERSVITKHIRNAFRDGELDPAATFANLHKFRLRGGGPSIPETRDWEIRNGSCGKPHDQ